MTTVSKSAASSAVNLFATVSVTATAITTAVQAVGNAFDVMGVKSNDWLQETRERSAAMAVDRSLAIKDDVAISMASRITERNKTLAGNPDLKAAYEAALAKLEEALAAQ